MTTTIQPAADIANDARQHGYTPILVRDNDKPGDQLCRLWDCNGTLAIETNGNTIWDTADRDSWAEALEACGLAEGPTLAERLQRTLDAQGCSVAEAARLAGLDHMQVYRIAKGINDNPKVKTLETIVTAIGATMGELFADEP